MKKIFFLFTMLVFAFSNLQADSQNFQDGTFNCVFRSKADKNWNEIYKLSKEQMKGGLFSFEKKGNKLIDATKVEFDYVASFNSSDVYSDKKGNSVLIVDNKVNVGDFFTLGFSLKKKDQPNSNLLATCKRIK